MHHRQPLALLFCCLGFACASSEAPRAARKPEAGGGRVGAPLPGLVVQTVKGGRSIDLSDMKGKVVLLDIWASWCGPCKEEMPLLDEMAGRLKPKGIEFVAVSIDEDKAAAESFLRTRGKWSLTIAHDPKGKVPDAMQPPKMPTSYIVDAQGIVRYVNAGFDRSDVKKIEDRLLTLAADVTE
jgi:thiol-disulfide isomerase/thioredoxin